MTKDLLTAIRLKKKKILYHLYRIKSAHLAGLETQL